MGSEMCIRDRFYDRAKPLDKLDGVSVETETEGTLYLDFRFEGGPYMTQINPNRTGRPRDVKVYYAEGIGAAEVR